jgi:hypothetical protein
MQAAPVLTKFQSVTFQNSNIQYIQRNSQMFLQGVQPISVYGCAGYQWKISTVKILTKHSSTSTRSPSIQRPSSCVATDT